LVSDTVRAAKAAYTIARQIMTGFFAGPVAEGGGGRSFVGTTCYFVMNVEATDGCAPQNALVFFTYMLIAWTIVL